MVRRRRTVKRRRPAPRRRMAMRPMVREEMKTLDKLLQSISCSADGTEAQTQLLLNNLPPGTDGNSRVGKKVLMKALQLRGRITPGSTAVDNKVTILLVYVRSNNKAATPTVWADMLTSQSPDALSNRDNATKFKILRRWDYALHGNTNAVGNVQDSSSYVFEQYVVFKKPLIAQWIAQSAAGAIGDFEKGSLHLCCLSLGAEAGTTKATLVVSTRLYFCECDGYMF